MRTLLQRLLGLGDSGSEETTAQAETMAQAETATVRKIVGQLDALEPERARFLAAFAFILSRVANADSNISDVELRKMEQIVSELGGLPEQQAILVVQIAKSQQLLVGGTESYLVTRELNKIASREDKERLLHCLFAVSAADDQICLAEENEIRIIAEALGFEHREFTTVRSHYNQKRTILQNMPQRQ